MRGSRQIIPVPLKGENKRKKRRKLKPQVHPLVFPQCSYFIVTLGLLDSALLIFIVTMLVGTRYNCPLGLKLRYMVCLCKSLYDPFLRGRTALDSLDLIYWNCRFNSKKLGHHLPYFYIWSHVNVFLFFRVVVSLLLKFDLGKFKFSK